MAETTYTYFGNSISFQTIVIWESRVGCLANYWLLLCCYL